MFGKEDASINDLKMKELRERLGRIENFCEEFQTAVINYAKKETGKNKQGMIFWNNSVKHKINRRLP